MATTIIWRARTLGDILLSLPMLHALRQDGTPPLRVIGYPDAWDVVRPLIDETAPIEAPCFEGLFSGAASAGLRSWLRGTDLALALTSRNVRPALAAAGVPHVVQVPPWPPPGVHASLWLLAAGIGRQALFRNLRPALPLSPIGLSAEEQVAGCEELARAGLTHPIVIHPGSAEPWKRWPAERFARLADSLTEQGFEVALAKGAADGDVIADVLARQRRPATVLRSLPARSLAALLGRARLYIGNDSGVTHLAGASGVRTIALFGPTDPTSWAPRGHTRVLRACDKTVRYDGQIRVCDEPDCMSDITVDDVLRAVDRCHPGRPLD